MYTRFLDMQLPPGQSAFLWGARQTGKSSYLKCYYQHAILYDLLDTHEALRLLKQPALLREELLAMEAQATQQPIIIDEIQKVPELLNEVHWLIENKQMQFVLCGSSVRKMKTQSTNLLGGRAWLFHFYPLTFAEIPDFDLLKALQHGLIPTHFWVSSKSVKLFNTGGQKQGWKLILC